MVKISIFCQDLIRVYLFYINFLHQFFYTQFFYTIFYTNFFTIGVKNGAKNWCKKIGVTNWCKKGVKNGEKLVKNCCKKLL